ncbi:MAG: N-acetylglucosamine kinase [Armatimonadota bacterium]
MAYEVLTLDYALGIDGGGSKCDAVLVARDGTVAGWGRGGPTHPWYDSREVIAASFADAVTEALEGVRDARLWVAGGFHSPDAWDVVRAAGEVVATLRAGEVQLALASAGERWGMVVLAGTGSFVHVRTEQGRERHVGGLGPVLGDYGSAYDIGLKGLRAAFASTWLESRRTSLMDAVPEALGVEALPKVFDLVYHQQALSRRDIAALSRVVDREAEAGDDIAVRCVREAADELADFAVELVEELGMQDADLPVIASGSVAQSSRLWWERVCERIAEVVPGMRAMIPRVRPAVGAALIALREMGVETTPDLLDRIVQTQEEHLREIRAQANETTS